MVDDRPTTPENAPSPLAHLRDISAAMGARQVDRFGPTLGKIDAFLPDSSLASLDLQAANADRLAVAAVEDALDQLHYASDQRKRARRLETFELASYIALFVLFFLSTALGIVGAAIWTCAGYASGPGLALGGGGGMLLAAGSLLRFRALVSRVEALLNRRTD